MTIRYLVIQINLVHNLAVISNVSSGRPEKNGNDVRNHDLVTFLKLPNLTDGGSQHVDLPTSEKLANQGRTKPLHCNDRRKLIEF